MRCDNKAITPERLMEIEAREKAATPGPWTYKVRRDGSIYISMGNPTKGPHQQADFYFNEPEAAFTTEARQDIPDLIAEARRVVSRPSTPEEIRRRQQHFGIWDMTNGCFGERSE